MDTMEQQLLQCPVCTLYLHEGMSLSSHLDTHPKDQVILALCSLTKSGKPSWPGSRCSTPYDCGQSERSYRSRSRTPARRYRHRHSRTPSDPYRPPSASLEASSSTCKSDSYQRLEPGRLLATPLQEEAPAAPRATHVPDQLFFIPQSARSLSRHTDFVFSKQPAGGEPVPLSSFMAPKQGAPPPCLFKPGSSREPEERKEAKGLQYVAGSKPIHFVLPVTQPFVQSAHKNIVISTVAQNHSNNFLRPMFTSQFSSPALHDSSDPAPSSQTVYSEIVQDTGKNYAPAVPASKAPQEQLSENPVMFQNIMVFNPYASNLSNLYPQPGEVLGAGMTRSFSDPALDASVLKSSKSHSRLPQIGGLQELQSVALQVGNSLDELPPKNDDNLTKDTQIEEVFIHSSELILDQGDSNNENSAKADRVKILSNVKVELPIPNIPDVIDLTSSTDTQHKKSSDLTEPNLNEEESILPDFVDAELCQSYSQNRFSSRSNFSLSNSLVNPEDSCGDISSQEEGASAKLYRLQPAAANTFSVIKNIGNPNAQVYRENVQPTEEPKSEEPCILPDLTCNEKPSISPCSDLTNDSSEGIYERLCTLSDAASTSAKLPTVAKSPFPISAVSPVAARKNLFVKKTKKVLSIKPSKSNSVDIPSPSKYAWSKVDSAGLDGDGASSQSLKKSNVVQTEMSRLDGFFKELDKQKKDSEHSELSQKSPSPVEYRSLDASVSLDDSGSCDIEQSLDVGTECVVRTYNNDFRNCISEKTDTLKVNSDPSVDRLMDNLTQKNFTELETMRPVNVIAFGSILNKSPAESNAQSFTETDKCTADFSTLTKEKQGLESFMRESYLRDNAYSEYFVTAKGNFSQMEAVDEHTESNSEQKLEICTMDDDDEEKKQAYISWQPTQKEEFGFSNFLDCSYGQSLYQKVEEGKTAKAVLVRNEGDQRSQFSLADCGAEHGDYAELICPQNSYSEQDVEAEVDQEQAHKGAFLASMGGSGELDALNIRTDERMPPRGELSEQESSGDTPWPGMYCDVVGGSTSYDLLARESWPSDGSDTEMPVSPAKHAYNEAEDMPIVVGVKPPDRNYRCATCGLGFNCPKERRVHRSKEHPAAASLPPAKRAPRRRRTPLPKIKSEKPSLVKTEPPAKLEEALELSPVKLLDELEERKPKLELLKEEPRRKKKDYLCATCKLEFTTEPAFNYHLKTHPLECLTCGKYFHKRANLQLHVKRHLGIKKYRCDICEKRFVTKQKLVEHYNVHTGVAPIKCTLCGETFRRHSNMVQHRNRHHLNIKKRLRDYVCHCGEVYHSKKKLAWHKEVHDEKPKACLHCSEKFVHVASLTRHMRRAHNSFYIPDSARQKENVSCPVCSHVYLKSSIEMHLRTHSGSKPYSCVICSKSFSTKWNLKLHRWTHANRSSKPFKCSLCKGAFVRHTDYVSHMNSHKSVRPYTCNYCGCQFIRKYNCQRHVKEHENAKKYVCQVPDCGKTFHRSYYLSEHMSVHSGARPFSCNICGKTSSTKSNHNKHIKIHHAREPVATEG